MRLVVDVEANGLLSTATVGWCMNTKDLDTGKTRHFNPEDMAKQTFRRVLDKATAIIGQSFLGYDIPLLKLLYDYELPEACFVVDIYILSQILEPQRKKHENTGGRKGPHSLENMGNFLGRIKPEHEDWTQYSEEMKHRCAEDVEITYLEFNRLNKKADIFNPDSKWLMPYKIESGFQGCIVEQETKGFLLDLPKLEENIKFFDNEVKLIDDEYQHQLPKKLIVHEGKLTDEWREKRELELKERGKEVCLEEMQAEDRIESDESLTDKDIKKIRKKVEKSKNLFNQAMVVFLEEHSGPYKLFKKAFKGDGELSITGQKWLDESTYTDKSVIGGPFTRISFIDFKMSSLPDIKEYLLSVGWKPMLWNYKKDPVTWEKTKTSPKLDKDDPFLGVKGKLGKALSRRIICKHRQTQLEGFKRDMRPDGRLPAGISGIADTARSKHVKVVNVPGSKSLYGEKMREVFTVAKGYKLVGVDADSCQIRMLCHHMGDDNYTIAVVEGDKDKGTDVHSLNAVFTGLTREEAKTFIYGFLFGSGDERTGLVLGKNAAFGRKVKNEYIKSLPKLKELIDRIKKHKKDKGYIQGLDGREIYVNSDHKTLCYQLQSDEAIMMKVATLFLMKEVQKKGLDAHMVAHVHDEFQMEVREDQAEEVAAIARDSIVRAGKWLNLKIPMAGSSNTGNSWWETH